MGWTPKPPCGGGCVYVGRPWTVLDEPNPQVKDAIVSRPSNPLSTPNPIPIRRAVRVLTVAVSVLGGAAAATAQQGNPVYVDDSPRAWELFRTAQDQVKDNLGESVRLYQELLDDYGMKLLPINELAADHFTAVRARVLAELTGNDALLKRYRMAQTAEATRLLESGQLERLAMTRSLTEPGLEALLQLAQSDLESARFHAALDRLWQAVRHPDLAGRRASHCWYMIGAAASYLSEAEALTQAVTALDSMGPEGRSLRTRLDHLLGAVRPGFEDGTSSLDPARSAEIDRLVAQPIWSLPLERTPLSLRLGEPAGAEPPTRRHAETLRLSGTLLTTAPTVAGSRIFINEGRTVHAVERFTGRPVWPPHIEREPPSSMDQGSRQIADLNIVALSGCSLVTITGHAYADAAKSDRTVVCLEADTGRLRWSRRVDRLSISDELDGLFPHGAPVIGDGMVYVLARKVSRQLLTSCYLIAMDLSDGRLRWARHVASSGGIRSRFARPFSSPAMVNGDIAVATAIGVVARLDATTGETRWLRRYNPPLSPYLADRRPWEISSPVVTTGGLLAIRPDHRRVVLLDWETGDDVDSAGSTTRDTWNSPRYLLARGEMVYGIGSEIRAFHAENLGRPLWTFPRQTAEPDPRLFYDADSVEIRGRVQIVDGGLIVPTVEGLLFLDGETGEAVHRVDVEAIGNPLASGPQLILAAADTLQAYMPFDRAEQMLRERITRTPDDPAPSLALMRLGVRVRDLGLALEAADMSIRAINGLGPGRLTDAARRELFEILLDLDREKVAETIEQGEALHAMIGVVAQEPQQRVEHLLAYGDWLSSHALGRSIEAYQAILSTPMLAETPRRDDGLVRPAATWAAQRVGNLIKIHGAGVYRPQAEFARDRLRHDRGDDPETLLALAREFPFAEASLDAARAAAEGYANLGDVRGALGALAATYRLAPVEQRAGVLLGEIVAASERAGWTTHARAGLEYAVNSYGAIPLTGGAGALAERTATAWLARMRHDEGHRLPTVGENQGSAERFAGSLVPTRAGMDAAGRPTDRVLVYDPPRLALLAGATLDSLWSTVPGVLGEPSILRFDDEGLLLWMDLPGTDPRAVMLDAFDGSQRWISSDLEMLMADPGRWGGANDLMPRGQQFDPSEIVPVVGDDTLVVLRRSGAVVALDLADGNTRRWQRTRQPPLRQIHLETLNEFALVLAGAQQAAEGRELVPLIVVLDPETGDTLVEIEPLDEAPVHWMTIGPLATLIYGNSRGIEAFDLMTGRRCWSLIGPDAIGTPRGWLAAGHLVVESPVRPADGVNPLRAVGLADGVISDPFDTPEHGEWDRLDLRELLVDRDRVFARYGERVVRYSPEGKILGADAVSSPRDYRWLLPTADRLVLVNRFKSEQVMVPGEARRQTQHTYRVYGISENCRLTGEGAELPPLPERLETAGVIDGWLLLSTGTETLAVAMPVQ